MQKAPINKSIPYVNAPEEIIPGIANYYATTYFDGHDYASVLIKTREGRPVKSERNQLARINPSPTPAYKVLSVTCTIKPRLQGHAAAGTTGQIGVICDKGVKRGLPAAEDNGKQAVLFNFVYD
ncbi:MAG: hypothetical protein U5L96_19860 [Owenweeksia sp.]|nr:hypothetical protein [Owenweeksia sp.]